MTLESGTKLGRYEIRSKIGEGGMGEALKELEERYARRETPGMYVAVGTVVFSNEIGRSLGSKRTSRLELKP